MTQPLAAPAESLPQLSVSCPRCGAAAGQLCTSHNGTRPRRNDVHRDRTTAHAAARPDGTTGGA